MKRLLRLADDLWELVPVLLMLALVVFVAWLLFAAAIGRPS